LRRPEYFSISLTPAASLPGLTGLDRAIQYPPVGGYWIARSSRAMTA
jgi:hypothetical protein